MLAANRAFSAAERTAKEEAEAKKEVAAAAAGEVDRDYEPGDTVFSLVAVVALEADSDFCTFLRESNDTLARAQLLACEAIVKEAAAAAAAVATAAVGGAGVQRSRKEGGVHCQSYWQLWDLEGRVLQQRREIKRS